MTTNIDAEFPTPETPEDTLALLVVQNALYGQLESLARRQRSLISGNDTGALLVLLAERQKLSEKLAEIAERLEPARRDWLNYQGRLTRSAREQADSLLAETRRRLRGVIEGDEEDARLLAARKQGIARDLSTVHAAGGAMSAYRVPSGGPGCLDRLDEDPS